jgi:misacylated tRNA(Ala) deacylase
MTLVFRDDPYAKSCTARVIAVDARGVRLDQTVFYPTGGGQPGDSGHLRLGDGTTLAVIDAVKGEGPDEVIHVLAPGMAPPAPGTHLTAEIDWARRHRHMRMHTALHLLCAIVPGGVMGGQIGDGKGRLDFDIQDTVLDKDWITAELNARIQADRPVTPRGIT